MIKEIKFYFFTDKLDNIIIDNILKFKKIGIIYELKNIKEVNHNNLNIISKFCKKNNIKFYISNSYKLVLKYKANGIFITYDNKKNLNYINFQKRLEIIGSAHNQIEYSLNQPTPLRLNPNCRFVDETLSTNQSRLVHQPYPSSETYRGHTSMSHGP